MLTRPVIDDPININIALSRSASTYSCAKNNPRCGGHCLVAIENARQLVAAQTSGKESTLTFANGLIVALATLWTNSDAYRKADAVEPEAGDALLLAAIEALRVADRILDSDIDAACEVYERERQREREAKEARARNNAEEFDFMKVTDVPF